MKTAHGTWCGARTYPTRCRTCGAQVFYFSCECGSKVFFDSLGGSWPVHDCVQNILDQVEISIQQEYARRLARQLNRRREWRPPITARQPQRGERITEVGIVREIRDVDVFEKFKVSPDSSFAVAALGEISSNDQVQITFHVDDLAAERITSYTAFVKRSVWNSINAERGDLLRFTVDARAFPGKEHWVCANLCWEAY